jgi:uncharacterized protein DUF6519/carboxypeptidase family protein/parallel beta helix pectate lyase-like protein
MGGDYTRWTFNPARDYSELFKQQGRVDLDADWNEFVEIVNRRWRAETMDIIGRAVVPSFTTPDAFQIIPAGPGQFTIGVGRMYVDGLLAECHGVSPLVYDATLGEVNGSAPVPFNQQPYFPNPTPPPSTGPAVDLIYLDVWQREVTALQDPAIREKALGGPDTTTRMQTVWQVKILPNVGAHSCGDQIGAWDTLTAPSAGRLTTSTVVAAPSPNPCILSPTGGYRGLENRLYRVEVHVAGTVGGANPAKFKWSRDNASVVSAVNSISAPGGPNSVLKLASLGRDRVLRFSSGDWVEVLDDNSELAGQAGFLTQVTAPPDEANRTITVQPPIPAALFDPSNVERHTRVRRWDQRNTGPGSNVNATTGLIDVTSTAQDIEDGIQVTFSDDPSGGQLHVGDYWIFAARTVDGSVEALQKTPPQGILHHYARLGFMTWAAGGAGTFGPDCRQFWPPAGGGDCTGCCTVTVGDGVNSHGNFTDIQKAIDSLGPAGGEVCLGRGIFVVPNTIRIDGSRKNVIVRGMGWATKLIFSPDGQSGSRVLFSIESTSHITLESFFAVAESAQSMVRITDSQFCTVRDTALINLSLAAASGTAFTNNNLATGGQAGRAIELAGVCVECNIHANTLIAGKGIVSTSGTSGATGTLNGVVNDATGAVIPGATVTLTGATGTTRSAVTEATGKLSFTALAPGIYTLSIGGVNATPQLTIAAGVITNATISRVAAPAGTAITITTTTTGGGGQADVRELEICNNRIFAVQCSILLLKTEDCDILANRLLGLSQAVINKLREQQVTPQNIDEFQHLVLQAITNASAAFSFHGAGIVLEIATRISISENTISGLMGISAFIVAEARIQNNQVLAFVGSLILDGFGVRISGNFIAGLLAGFIQAGIMLDLVCDTNVWIGFFGLLFAPLKTVQGMFSSVMGPALEKGSFATSGSTVLDNAGNFIGSTGATISGVSFLGVIKVHHEVFITFAEGVAGLLGVIGADISIVDSSFEFCAVAGVSWFMPVQAASFEANLAPQFIVERNVMNIRGVGVACRCVEGVVRGNRIQCGESAIVARCKRGVVQDNIINSTQQQASTTGLIVAGPFRPSNDDLPSFRIAGNRLENGPGHGIVLEALSDVIIENNVIAGMAGNGITAASDAILLDTARICGNQISFCRAVKALVSFPGAVILPEVASNLEVQGNRLSANQGAGLILNILAMGGNTSGNLRLLVQDNSMDSQGSVVMGIIVGYAIQFTGNQCIERISGPLTHPLVTLIGQWIVATGNTVLHNQPGPGVSSLVLQPAASTNSNAIATTNILNGNPQINGTFAHLLITPNITV